MNSICLAPVSLKLDVLEVHFSSPAHVVVNLQLTTSTLPTQWSNNGDHIGEKGSVGFRVDRVYDIVKVLIVVGQHLPHRIKKTHSSAISLGQCNGYGRLWVITHVGYISPPT